MTGSKKKEDTGQAKDLISNETLWWIFKIVQLYFVVNCECCLTFELGQG